jgi:hypothetical protein
MLTLSSALTIARIDIGAGKLTVVVMDVASFELNVALEPETECRLFRKHYYHFIMRT